MPPEVREKITKDVPLEFAVPLSSRRVIAELCPLTGKIKAVTIQWPRNCNGYVHVAFGHGGKQVVPSEPNTFLSLDDTTWGNSGINEPIVKNEYLWADLRNGDGANPHTITLIITVEGTED